MHPFPRRQRRWLRLACVLIVLFLFEARLISKYALQEKEPPHHGIMLDTIPHHPALLDKAKQIRIHELWESVKLPVKNLSRADRVNAETACRHGPRTSRLMRPDPQLLNWTRANLTFVPAYTHPTDLWENIPPAPLDQHRLDDDEAGCEFHVPVELARHFPHVLQNLYSCWSYWQYRIEQQPTKNDEAPNRPTKIRPVLYIPEDRGLLPIDTKAIQAWRRNPSEDYVGHILRFLYDWGVVFRRVTPESTSSHRSVRPRLFGEHDPDGYALWSSRHATALHNSVVQDWLHLPSLSQHAASSCTRRQRPRVTLLDRTTTSRRILHAEALRRALTDALSQFVDDISTVTFDQASFASQMAVLSQTDILITPHGAQLASIPFLPRCASVLEIFPFRYCLPYFYGSLAAAAGMQYHYLFLGNECMIETEKRGQRRSANLCLDIHAVVQAVTQLVDEWKPCDCRQDIAD